MWVRIAVLGFWIVFLGVLTAFSSYKNRLRPVQQIAISLDTQLLPMISADSVNKLLTLAPHDTLSPQKSAINLRELEVQLENNNLIKKVEAFLTIDDILHVDVCPRVPVVRIGTNFYLDNQGSVIPLSPFHEADVPEVCGSIGKESFTEVAALAVAVSSDPFMSSHLGCIQNHSDGFHVEVINHSYVIKMRSLENFKQKFANYKAFYAFGTDHGLLDKYKEIVLDDTNQVIGTKI